MTESEIKIIEGVSLIREGINATNIDKTTIAKGLAKLFVKTHRTLQQSTMQLIPLFIEEISNIETDLRNEASIEWCKKVTKLDHYFPFI
jgi:hypothetical protein